MPPRSAAACQGNAISRATRLRGSDESEVDTGTRRMVSPSQLPFGLPCAKPLASTRMSPFSRLDCRAQMFLRSSATLVRSNIEHPETSGNGLCLSAGSICGCVFPGSKVAVQEGYLYTNALLRCIRRAADHRASRRSRTDIVTRRCSFERAGWSRPAATPPRPLHFVSSRRRISVEQY